MRRRRFKKRGKAADQYEDRVPRVQAVQSMFKTF